MVLWIVIGVSIILFFGFPMLTLRVIKKTQKMASEEDKKSGYAELKASILFLQMAFPAVLSVLGALGYGLYEGTVEKVTTAVQTRVNTLIEKQKIVDWTNEIEDYRKKAESDANLIAAISNAAEDSIGQVVKRSFLDLLPKGTIIPFKGRRDDIDFDYWAICDGSKGTPNLTDRFILGGNFVQIGGRGGANSHTHVARTIPKGQVRKLQANLFPHSDGNIRPFEVERHDHSFNGIESPVTVVKSDHIPPYYRLVFLMKIK